VHYKRFKTSMSGEGDKQELVLPKAQRVPLNVLLMVVRIKESRNTTP
jgi:hypothetical protein